MTAAGAGAGPVAIGTVTAAAAGPEVADDVSTTSSPIDAGVDEVVGALAPAGCVCASATPADDAAEPAVTTSRVLN